MEARELSTRARLTPLRDVLPPRSAPAAGAVVALDGLPLPGCDATLAVLEVEGSLLASPVVAAGRGLRRAGPDAGAAAGVLRLAAAGAVAGRFRFLRLGEVEVRPADRERALEVDQSNESVVVGERVVLKYLARVSPGPQQALDLPRHLAAVGFTQIPAPLGAVTWDAPAGGETLLATAAAYLPGAEDGWEWLLRLAWRDLGRGEGEGGEGVRAAGELGSLTAGLHLALATASPALPDPVTPWPAAAVASWRVRSLATVAAAAGTTEGAPGERLAARRAAIEAALLDCDPAGAPAIRVHGDLHVGQFLRHPGGDAISDFDGNPLAPPEERVAPLPAAKDVASLLRSLDHVARICRRDGAGAQAVDAWSGAARAACLAAYRERLAAAGRDELLDDGLLRPFELVQACHELVYASRYLPRWLIVADLALSALLP